jgi:L-fucose isomerase-like protein
MSEQFRYISVASGVNSEHAVAALSAQLSPALAAAGGLLGDESCLGEQSVVCFLVLTGGTERQLLALHEARRLVAPGEPIILIVHPSHNSLSAAFETLARVKQDGGRGRILYLRGGSDPAGTVALGETAHDLQVRRFLHDARIGVVGGPSDWLVASSPSAETVRSTWGPTLVPIDMDEVLAAYRQQSVQAGVALASSVTAGANEIVEPNGDAVKRASELFPTLQTVVEHERLTAITVRCFDLITALNTSGCLALAELNDQGVIAGCEGDLVSTVGMLWLHRLLELSPWMANPVQVDPLTGTLRLAHCTVPRSLVSAYRLRSHFESGQGVGIQGDLPYGDVTLVRIGGSKMNKLWAVEGEAIPAPLREDLCRTQMSVRVGSETVSELLRTPLGNHVLTVPGRHRDRITTWWQTIIQIELPV